MNPRLNQCIPAHLRNNASTAPNHVYLGCFTADATAGAAGSLKAYSSASAYASAAKKCRASCAKEKQTRTHIFAHLAGSGQCRCKDSFGGTTLPAPRCAWPCKSCSSSGAEQVFRVGTWLPPLTPTTKAVANQETKITIFLWANPRLAAIFRTCRLAQQSGRFTYDVYDVRHQVRNDNKVHVAELFRQFPGPKIIVFDGCCVPGEDTHCALLANGKRMGASSPQPCICRQCMCVEPLAQRQCCSGKRLARIRLRALIEYALAACIRLCASCTHTTSQAG